MQPEAIQLRLDRAQQGLRARDLDALLVTPGPDLRYLVGYDAVPLERLTCLVIPAQGQIHMVVPRLEEPAARASHAGGAHIEIHTWGELDDPFALTASLVGRVSRIAVDDRMWAEKVLNLRGAMHGVEQFAGGLVMRELRQRKGPDEIAHLLEAGAAIDRVHAQVPGLLRAGRTEHEVARDIAELIIGEGHVSVDFVIVAAGPNGASPHHEASDRVLVSGEPIVIDIGGTMPSGYTSDETRMYCIGEPPADFATYYEVLFAAQAAAVAHVRPGVTCESIDAVARAVITDAGYGDYFVHRTGHGIGMETHEHPYIVAGNTLALEPGMAFSIEPGIYLPGRHGARIEDIIICGDDGAVVVNHRPRELVIA